MTFKFDNVVIPPGVGLTEDDILQLVVADIVAAAQTIAPYMSVISANLVIQPLDYVAPPPNLNPSPPPSPPPPSPPPPTLSPPPSPGAASPPPRYPKLYVVPKTLFYPKLCSRLHPMGYLLVDQIFHLLPPTGGFIYVFHLSCLPCQLF